ncbi:telomere length regulation protein TEL2 homolog [Pomacea canaliculata]|uniref:telomere length regulation protein TEL2 homolog n=1 Tax=Pomacea canaliculata TaxID=400727 RepID=UPI000D725F74|nr:telomere length regulation protein TEL2 homolog [Pomacea canaliculata]
MSHDKPVTKVKTPVYIRDCMEGLLKVKDPDTIEASLVAAEKLIRKGPDGLAEIAEEFTKILLHSTESYGIPEFVLHRFKAMVALAVHCPSQVARYLSAQFYERNYNIRQRLDMLEVLATAAQELSQPEASTSKATSRWSPVRHTQAESTTNPETWQQIVQQRINSKTRRFIKGPSKPEPTPVPNRFGHVAGEFFFPLMRFYDKSESVFDLMGSDSLVLHRLVYTLAIILYAAINTTAASQMGKSLLEFTWGLRIHSDVSVRQAVLVATSMVLLVVPGHFLLTDLQMDIMETKEWLQMVLEKDVNTECRKLAMQALTLLDNTVAMELKNTS